MSAKQASKYFKNELDFTAMPGTVKNANPKTCVIIDVRKKEEYDKKHIPNALNLPF